MLFDERPLERSNDYFCKLCKAANIFTRIETRSFSEFEHLIRSNFVNDEDSRLYVTKRVMSMKE
jgi:hypothetical protein